MRFFDGFKKSSADDPGHEPDIEKAWYGRGLALYKLEKLPEAIGCFEKFIEVAPPQSTPQVENVKQFINLLR